MAVIETKLDPNKPDETPGPEPFVEANYEFEHNAADLGTPEILRRQAYWALLSGAAGQLYGNRYTWPFIGGWQDNLDTPGSAGHLSAKIGYQKAGYDPDKTDVERARAEQRAVLFGQVVDGDARLGTGRHDARRWPITAKSCGPTSHGSYSGLRGSRRICSCCHSSSPQPVCRNN